MSVKSSRTPSAGGWRRGPRRGTRRRRRWCRRPDGRPGAPGIHGAGLPPMIGCGACGRFDEVGRVGVVAELVADEPQSCERPLGRPAGGRGEAAQGAVAVGVVIPDRGRVDDRDPPHGLADHGQGVTSTALAASRCAASAIAVTDQPSAASPACGPAVLRRFHERRQAAEQNRWCSRAGSNAAPHKSQFRGRHDRGPRADAFGERIRAAHRRHLHSAQPGRCSGLARPGGICAQPTDERGDPGQGPPPILVPAVGGRPASTAARSCASWSVRARASSVRQHPAYNSADELGKVSADNKIASSVACPRGITGLGCFH